MCRIIEKLKILYSVIASIMIDVMHVFRSQQRSSKIFFHHKTMHILTRLIFQYFHQIPLGHSMFPLASPRISILPPTQIVFIAKRACIYMPVTFAALFILSGLFGCKHDDVVVVHAPASVNCDPAKEECISVTRPFLDEHGALFAENIRLKAALKFCNQSIEQNR